MPHPITSFAALVTEEATSEKTRVPLPNQASRRKRGEAHRTKAQSDKYPLLRTIRSKTHDSKREEPRKKAKRKPSPHPTFPSLPHRQSNPPTLAPSADNDSRNPNRKNQKKEHGGEDPAYLDPPRRQKAKRNSRRPAAGGGDARGPVTGEEDWGVWVQHYSPSSQNQNQKQDWGMWAAAAPRIEPLAVKADKEAVVTVSAEMPSAQPTHALRQR